jgi:hypothetical protein
VSSLRLSQQARAIRPLRLTPEEGLLPLPPQWHRPEITRGLAMARSSRRSAPASARRSVVCGRARGRTEIHPHPSLLILHVRPETRKPSFVPPPVAPDDARPCRGWRVDGTDPRRIPRSGGRVLGGLGTGREAGNSTARRHLAPSLVARPLCGTTTWVCSWQCPLESSAVSGSRSRCPARTGLHPSRDPLRLTVGGPLRAFYPAHHALGAGADDRRGRGFLESSRVLPNA